MGMDLQKVKEALEIGLLSVIMAGQTRYQKDEADEIREALAELEKPADEDADKVTSEIEDIHFLLNDGSIMNKRHGKCASLIQQYAEAYHAKKCGDVLKSAADRAEGFYVSDCCGCGEKCSSSCDDRCSHIEMLRASILESHHA